MGFLRAIAEISIGVAMGNEPLRKEISRAEKRRIAEEEKSRKEAEKDALKKESAEKRRRAIESQRNWEAVRRANEERRRKGQPELPLPPRWYY